ncbi:MAG: Efflux ABC transporter, permease protein, partial [uncultured Corynebacteriales bacterium]
DDRPAGRGPQADDHPGLGVDDRPGGRLDPAGHRADLSLHRAGRGWRATGGGAQRGDQLRLRDRRGARRHRRDRRIPPPHRDADLPQRAPAGHGDRRQDRAVLRDRAAARPALHGSGDRGRRAVDVRPRDRRRPRRREHDADHHRRDHHRRDLRDHRRRRGRADPQPGRRGGRADHLPVPHRGDPVRDPAGAGGVPVPAGRGGGRPDPDRRPERAVPGGPAGAVAGRRAAAGLRFDLRDRGLAAHGPSRCDL